MTGTDPHRRYAAVAHYRIAAGRDPGQPVVMLHGLGGTCTQVWPYLDAEEVGSTRLAPDLRGHGRTPLVGDADAFTFHGLTDDLVALLDSLHYPPATVVGVSMGAGVAVDLALRYPSRVRGLVLIRPAWLDEPAPANLSVLRRVGRLLQAFGPSAGLTHFLDSREYRSILAESPAAAASLVAQFRDDAAARRAVRLIRMPLSTPIDRLDALGGIEVDTVVVAAPRDPLHPLSVAEAWAASIPGCGWSQITERDADPDAYAADLTRITRRFVTSAHHA